MKDEGAASPAPLVRFLIGAAGSGKTHRFLGEMTRHEAAGRTAFYLVPEQSTYVADRQILEPPGPEAIRHVRAVSFRRLAWIIDDRALGPRPPEAVLDASGRRILLRAVFAGIEPRLRAPFQSLLDRPGFLEAVASVLHDLRFEAGPGVDAWLAGANRIATIPPDLETKLEAIAALRAAYDRALIDRGVRDPEELLQKTPKRIEERHDLFRGVPILVDGFLSFTRLEAEILMSLARVGAEVVVSLCCDPDLIEVADSVRPALPSLRIHEWPPGIHARVRRPVFLASFRTLCELRERLRASGIATRCEPVAPARGNARTGSDAPAKTAARAKLVPPRFEASADLARLEAAILSRARDGSGAPLAPPSEPAPVDVSLIAARDPSHEVETWARQIDRWIRCDPNPVRPGEVAVIVRDLEMYRPIVEETFARYRIPVFVDRHWEIGSRPLVRTVLDALEVLLSGWSREAVVAFLRSPLLGVRPGEVDILENLSLEAGLDYEKWTGPPWEPLRRPPRTHYSSARDFEHESAELAREPDAPRREDAEDADDSRQDRIEQARVGIANRLRSAVLEPLKDFERAWHRKDGISGKDAVIALRRWCASTGVFERALAGTGTEAPQADAAREVEAFDHVCDQVASETGDEKIPIETFARLLGAGLGTLKLGKTPTGLDRVTIAEVQRSRVGEVKRAIVGGLCARDFPRSAAAGRFFNESERTLLSRLGLDLGAPAPMRQEEEGYFLYVALTRAREALLMTRPTLDLEGKPLEASPFVQEIRAALPGLTEEVPSLEESPADLRDAQTSEEIAARVGAYIAARLDRRRSGRAADPDPSRASRDDERILTAYNRLIVPASPGRRFLQDSSRLWGYDNRPVLPRAVIAAALGQGGRIATSAGRLETYAQCAYRHFARHMLRLEERPRSEVTPLENGLLAHRALEVLYSEGIPPAERRIIRERLEDVFSRIEDDVRLKAYQVDPSGGFRWRNARGQLRRFLEVEAKRLARSDFRPYLFEQEFGTPDVPPLRIPLPTGGEVLLRGRIDRIDILEPRGEGRPEALVIDYKSRITPGRGRPALVEDGLDLQLAVYLIVASEILDLDPIGALYAPVLPRPKGERSKDPENPLDIRMVGLLPESERERVTGGVGIIQGARRKLKDKGELQGVIEKAREMIVSHATGIMDGRIDVAPVRVGRLPCDHCEFAALCRVDRSYNPDLAPPSQRR